MKAMRDFRLPPTVEDAADKLSRNVTNNLPTKAVQLSIKVKTTSKPHNARTSDTSVVHIKTKS
jgi:hypothetical protein